MKIQNKTRVAKSQKLWHKEDGRCRPLCFKISGFAGSPLLTDNPEFVTCKRCLAIMAEQQK